MRTARSIPLEALAEQALKYLSDDKIRSVVARCVASVETVGQARSPPAAGSFPPHPLCKEEEGVKGFVSVLQFRDIGSCRPSISYMDHIQRSATPCFPRICLLVSEMDTSPLENHYPPFVAENDRATSKNLISGKYRQNP